MHDVSEVCCSPVFGVLTVIDDRFSSFCFGDYPYDRDRTLYLLSATHCAKRAARITSRFCEIFLLSSHLRTALQSDDSVEVYTYVNIK
jgi:hypothetical protein